MPERAPRRVVFLSTTLLGEELLRWLGEQPGCRLVLAKTDGGPVKIFPPHDLGLGFLYQRRIAAAQLTEARWVNFHPGPLPEFRGRNLAYHAIMEGAREFGGSVHYMDEGFDTGDLIETVRFPIDHHDTAGDLVRRSHEALAWLFRKHVPALLAGDVPARPQGPGRYFRPERLDDCVDLTSDQSRRIRALTVAPRFYATAVVNGRPYRLVPDEEKKDR